MRSAFALRIISGKLFLFRGSGKSAELVGAKPLHLLMQTALPLKSPTGAFIAAQTRTFLNHFFTEKAQRSAGDFCCSTALSQKAVLHLPLAATAPPCESAFVAARRPRQTQNINHNSAKHG